MNDDQTNPPAPVSQSAPAGCGLGAANGSEIWWLAHMAVSYAEDMCFCLCETKEWEMVHQALGLPLQIENKEIGKRVDEELVKRGWKWSAFGPEWQSLNAELRSGGPTL